MLTAIKFDQLPLNLAFRMVKGNGKRKVAYFTDPNCPYCNRSDGIYRRELTMQVARKGGRRDARFDFVVMA